MSEPFYGEIVLFAGNFAPRGWAFCEGQILSIAQNTALFSLLGTTYGGNGQTTFALPDLRGRAPIHPSQGPGLSPHTLGQSGGSESVTLTQQEMPTHIHAAAGSTGAVNTTRPTNAVPAKGGSYTTANPDTTMSSQAIKPAGGSQPHSNMPPYLALNYIICIEGIYPSRN